MSGHSKWSTIKRKKGALDAKRGKIFTQLIREITVAVKEGSADVESNPRLRLAIANAKGNNMPKENIERAIKKASGADAGEYFETTFEGYGPHGIAVFVECTTDNNNRTVSNVRSIFTKHGGSLGTNGSLEFIFERKGIFLIAPDENIRKDEFMLEIIDAGAEDIDTHEGYYHVTCAFQDFGNLQKKFEELNVEPQTAEIQRIPNTTIRLDDFPLRDVMKLIDALDDDDDVKKVYHNLEITDEQMEKLEGDV